MWIIGDVKKEASVSKDTVLKLRNVAMCRFNVMLQLTYIVYQLKVCKLYKMFSVDFVENILKAIEMELTTWFKIN